MIVIRNKQLQQINKQYTKQYLYCNKTVPKDSTRCYKHCKIPWFQRFLGFLELFSLKKFRRICPQHYGPGPPASAHGSTDFIKCRSLAFGSTAWIESCETVYWLLISAVHRRFDGGGDWLRQGGGDSPEFEFS
jgi:hypothetical protein